MDCYCLATVRTIIFNILIMILMPILMIASARAGISGGYGMTYTNYTGSSVTYCTDGNMSNQGGGTYDVTVQSGLCTISDAEYVPHSGNYRERMRVTGAFSLTVTSSSVYLDATKPISAQSGYISGSGGSDHLYVGESMKWCRYLVDDAGAEYLLSQGYCSGTPLPPTPPVPDTSCTINNGSALNISLGILERSELPTVPDSGTAVHKQIPVSCSGADVTVSMKLNYTPMTLGGSQAVKTSANGVGTAIIYNNKTLATTDSTQVKFLKGENILDLGFQAVRDSTVQIADIPTGAFSASAVMVMTQQ